MKNQDSESKRPNNMPVESSNSGGYYIGPMKEGENDFPNEEVWEVQSRDKDLAIEEFAEGPYGATTNEEKLGKVSDWESGQAVSGRFRDTNMIRSDRRTAIDEPDFKANPGSSEGQN